MAASDPRAELAWSFDGGPVLEVWRRRIGDRTLHWLEVQRGTPGVVIVPTHGGRLLLLEQDRPATGRRHLQFPRGFGEPGELPAETARRELLEETGLTAEEVSVVGSFYPDPGILSGRVVVTQARTGGLKPSLDGTSSAGAEHIVGTMAVAIETVPELVAKGAIDDGLTLAALALWFGAGAGSRTEACRK